MAVKRAWANVAAAQTDSVLVAAVAGRVIRVLALFVLAGGTATSVTLNSKGAGAGTAVGPAFPCGANGGLVLPIDRDENGWADTNAGEALTVTTGAGSTCGILVLYREV